MSFILSDGWTISAIIKFSIKKNTRMYDVRCPPCKCYLLHFKQNILNVNFWYPGNTLISEQSHKSLIESSLEYPFSAYGCYNKGEIYQHEMVQCRAASFVTVKWSSISWCGPYNVWRDDFSLSCESLCREFATENPGRMHRHRSIVSMEICKLHVHFLL